MSVTINHQTNFVSATSGNLSFATNVVVSSVGNLGVGTTSPRDPSSAYKGITLDGTTSGYLDINANTTRVLTIFGGTNDALLTNPTSTGAIIFSTNNTEISRFDSAGRFLLGTNSSTGVTAAAFKRGVATDCFLEMSGGNGTIATDSFVTGQDSGKTGYAWNRATAALLFGTNNIERARIDSSGNFGIGVTPSVKLDVLGSTGILTRAAATQDGVALVGRAGGTSSYTVTLTPTTLSANRTLTLPDNSGTVLTTGAVVTVAQGGTGLTSGTSGGIPYFSSTSAMTSSGVLAANALMVGGGAGAAPSTVTTGTNVLTALGTNVGSAGAFVVNGGALGTPSSGTVTNLTGTASININGTVGATTPSTGVFTQADVDNIRLDANTISSTNTNGNITIAPNGTGSVVVQQTDAGATAGPILNLYRNSASPAASDVIGQVLFQGKDSAGNDQTYAYIQSGIEDATSTSEDGNVQFFTTTAGTASEKMRLDASGNLGIGTSPSTRLHVAASSANIEVRATTTTSGDVRYGFDASGAYYNWIETVRSSGAMRFATANTEYMRLDASGNLGIGTTSPGAKLEVTGDIQQTWASSMDRFVGSKFSTTYELGLHFIESSRETRVVSKAGDGTGLISFYTGTTPTERARITSDGDLLVGTTGSIARLSVRGATSDSTKYTFQTEAQDGTDQLGVRCDGAVYMGLDGASPYNLTTGTAANATLLNDGFFYRSTSSIKYKQNVQDATHGLAEVMALRPVTYEGKSSIDAGKVFGGLIAEEVHDAGLTEFVQYADDGTPDALSYGNMVSLCIKAIQEQQAMIESLTARIAALEAKGA